MDYEVILELLKIDLQINVSKIDDLLMTYIESAEAEITARGINLVFGDTSDQLLVEEYAAWKYRTRAEKDAPMPLMVKAHLNNRLLSEKARGDS